MQLSTSDPESEKNQIIDIVAPSNRSMPWLDIPGETYEMWTIDIPDSAGYNLWHGPYTPPYIGEVLPNSGTNNLSYTGRFGGTSHSCPVVAGVAALVLSVNQSLTYLEVFDILTSTADEVGGYTYTNGWSEELGYGRVNACRAVLKAIMSVTGPSIVCSSNSTFTLHDCPIDTTVNWTESINLLYVSGQGTDYYTVRAHPYGSGGGWVQANITAGSCDAIPIHYVIDWVGPPYVNPETIQFTCAEGEGYLCTNAFGNEFSFYYTGPYNYFDIKLMNFSETQTLWQEQIEGTWGTVEYYPPEGTYKFMVRGNNDCGTATNWSKTTVDYVDCGWWFMNIVPNPATDEIKIEIKTDYIDTYTEGDTWEAEIYNQKLLLMHKTTRLKDKTYTINVSGWKEGIYFVRAKVNDKVVSGKLIISR